MRHDESSKRPRVDPAQNPRLAATLSRLAHGSHDLLDPVPGAPSSGLGPPGDGVYIPDHDDVEMLDPGDDAPAAAQDDDEEIIPTSGEVELFDAYAPPRSARLHAAASGEEEMVASDSDLQLIDPNAVDPPPLGDPGLGDPYADPIGAASADLYSSDGAGSPLDGQAGEASSEEASSPWAAEAGAGEIDARDLPSALAPVAAPERQPEAPARAAPSSSSHIWIVLFAVIALVASATTFLVLRFSAPKAPEGTSVGAGGPIQVPTSTAMAPPPPVSTPAEPPVPAAPSVPVEAPATASAAPEVPTPAISAVPSSAPAAPVGGVVGAPATNPPATNPPAGAGPSSPVKAKPGGTPIPTKKPSRIF